MSKSISLKSALLFQSITPLFFLIIIKYLDCKSIHRDAIQRVCVLARPVILAADGYPIMDDCGGTDGYVDTLRSIEDGDKDSKAWAESMGWKKKIDKGVL